MSNRCPKCGAISNSYNIGSGVIGALLLGPIGLLAGHTSNTNNLCQKCFEAINLEMKKPKTRDIKIYTDPVSEPVCAGDRLYVDIENREDELEGKNIPEEFNKFFEPSQEEFNKFFEDNILSQIEYSKTRFLDCDGNFSKISTSRMGLFNSHDKWLFDYDYDKKTQHFWYSYYRVYLIFMKRFSFQDDDRNRLMKSLVEKHFNLKGVTPSVYSDKNPATKVTMKSNLKNKVKITPVTFRKFENGDIIAFFPDTNDGKQVVSYEHNGQHSGSDINLVNILAKATPSEYADLKKELDKIYEHLTVID